MLQERAMVSRTIKCLRRTWNDASNGGEAIRVNNAFFVLEKFRETLFQFQMNIDGAVESKGMSQLSEDIK